MAPSQSMEGLAGNWSAPATSSSSELVSKVRVWVGTSPPASPGMLMLARSPERVMGLPGRAVRPGVEPGVDPSSPSCHPQASLGQ